MEKVEGDEISKWRLLSEADLSGGIGDGGNARVTVSEIWTELSRGAAARI